MRAYKEYSFWYKSFATVGGVLSLNLGIGCTANALETATTSMTESDDSDPVEAQVEREKVPIALAESNPPCIDITGCNFSAQLTPRMSRTYEPVVATTMDVDESHLDSQSITAAEIEEVEQHHAIEVDVSSNLAFEVEPLDMVYPTENIPVIVDRASIKANTTALSVEPPVEPAQVIPDPTSIIAAPPSEATFVMVYEETFRPVQSQLTAAPEVNHSTIAQNLTPSELEELISASEQLREATETFENSLIPGSFACINNSHPNCGNPPHPSSPWSRLPTNFRSEYSIAVETGSEERIAPYRQQLNSALQAHYNSLIPGSFACINNSDPRCENPPLFSSVRSAQRSDLDAHYESLRPGSFICIHNSHPNCGNPAGFSSPWAQFESSFKTRYYELIGHTSRRSPRNR